jgi:large subunit ribosomal protein L29
MTGAEAKQLTNDEIKIELKRLREKLFQLRVQRETEKVENTAQFKLLRKDIARIQTERTARRAAAAPAAASKTVKAPKTTKPAARVKTAKAK